MSELDELLAAEQTAKERLATVPKDPKAPQTIAKVAESPRAPRRGPGLGSFFAPGMLPRGMTLPTPSDVPTCSRCSKAPCVRNDLPVADGVLRVRYGAFCATCRDIDFSGSWRIRMAEAKKLVDPNARAREIAKLEEQRKAWLAKGRQCFA